MEYLFDLGLSLEEINNLKSKCEAKDIEKLEFFGVNKFYKCGLCG